MVFRGRLWFNGDRGCLHSRHKFSGYAPSLHILYLAFSTYIKMGLSSSKISPSAQASASGPQAQGMPSSPSFHLISVSSANCPSGTEQLSSLSSHPKHLVSSTNCPEAIIETEQLAETTGKSLLPPFIPSQASALHHSCLIH